MINTLAMSGKPGRKCEGKVAVNEVAKSASRRRSHIATPALKLTREVVVCDHNGCFNDGVGKLSIRRSCVSYGLKGTRKK